MAHVMFSYNWDHQGLVLEVVRILKSQGVDVWVDVQGSTILGNMAAHSECSVAICSSIRESLDCARACDDKMCYDERGRRVPWRPPAADSRPLQRGSPAPGAGAAAWSVTLCDVEAGANEGQITAFIHVSK